MKPQVTIDDFAKLDLRVGEVVEAVEVEGSDKLLKLTVNFGEELGTKTVFSGIKKWYTADSIQNRKFIFIVNLPPREFKFGISEAMILAVEDNNEAVLYKFDKDITNGSTIK